MYGRVDKKVCPVQYSLQSPCPKQKISSKINAVKMLRRVQWYIPIPQPRQARPILRDGLEAEWLEYPFLSHLVGNVSTLLQRDGSNDGVHGVRQNEFETGSLEVIRL